MIAPTQRRCDVVHVSSPGPQAAASFSMLTSSRTLIFRWSMSFCLSNFVFVASASATWAWAAFTSAMRIRQSKVVKKNALIKHECKVCKPFSHVCMEDHRWYLQQVRFASLAKRTFQCSHIFTCNLFLHYNGADWLWLLRMTRFSVLTGNASLIASVIM